MSALSITAVTSGAATNDLLAAQTADTHQHAHPASTTNGQQDTASLSPAARALSLIREGESISTVAVTMNTSVAAIDAYLNITPQTDVVAQRSTAIAGA
jgi:DNA-binding NarL/FixJ family response regulator